MNLSAVLRLPPYLDWRVVLEGLTAEGRPTHDEDTGELVLAPYRGRHIVDAHGRIVAEHIHDPADAALLVQSPRLYALVLEATAPGGLGPGEYERPGGWRDRALAAIADIGRGVELPPRSSRECA